MPDKNRPNLSKAKKLKSVLRCIYCDSTQSLDRDHIPPKLIFPKPRPSTLITVPSCRTCNRTYGFDDEYFGTILSLSIDPEESPKLKQVVDRTMRGFFRPESQRLKSSIYQNLAEVEVQTLSGVFIERRIRLTPDQIRFCSTTDRIVKGLFYHHFGRRVPPTSTVLTIIIHPQSNTKLLESIDNELDLLLRFGTRGKISEVFAYRFLLARDSDTASIWSLNFYNGRMMFFGMVSDPKYPSRS